MKEKEPIYLTKEGYEDLYNEPIEEEKPLIKQKRNPKLRLRVAFLKGGDIILPWQHRCQSQSVVPKHSCSCLSSSVR